MGVKITDMTTTTADGTEIVPTSKGGAPRSVTASSLKDYVVDQIEAITPVDTVAAGQDILTLKSGALKPTDIDVVLQRALDTMWGKTAIVTPVGADKLPILDDTVEKTVSVTVLAETIRGLIEAAILDVSDLSSGAGGIATTDYMLVTQGTTGKRIQISDLSTLIYASLAAHVAAKTSLGDNGADTDVLYVVRSGTAYKVALSALATYFAAGGTVTGSGTTDYLPVWTSSSALGTGPAIVEDNFAAGTNDQIPTALAVRTELGGLINDSVDIGAAIVGTDTILVDDGANGTQRKAAMSRVKTYMETSGVYKTIWVPAKIMTASTTAGATSAVKEFTTTNDQNHTVMTFAGSSADDNAEFDLVMPEAWDRGTIKAKLFWTNGHGDANPDEYVGFYLAGGARSNDDPLDATNGTEVLLADQLIVDDDLHVSDASAALTVGGTPALNDMIHFKLRRDYDYAGAGVAMDVDAYVFGVLIQYLENVVPAAW